jgi:ribosomal protein S1
MKRTVAVLTLLCALSLIAFAHEKEKHVMGTVTNIAENSITVETTAKKSVSVEATDKPSLKRADHPQPSKNLKVGDKVVVHADVSDNKLVANEVRFGAKAKSMEGMKGMEGMDHK